MDLLPRYCFSVWTIWSCLTTMKQVIGIIHWICSISGYWSNFCSHDWCRRAGAVHFIRAQPSAQTPRLDVTCRFGRNFFFFQLVVSLISVICIYTVYCVLNAVSFFFLRCDGCCNCSPHSPGRTSDGEGCLVHSRHRGRSVHCGHVCSQWKVPQHGRAVGCRLRSDLCLLYWLV